MSIKGLYFIVWMYFKKLIREILKAIWIFLTKKRYAGNMPKLKKAIMLTFLSINAIAWIVAPSYLLVSIPNEKIIIEAKAESVGDMVDTLNEAVTQDTVSGMEEQQASLEVAPSAVEDKICAVFGEDCEIMIAIAKAESGLKADSIGYNCMYEGKSAVCKTEDRHLAWSVDCGILQINHRGKVCPSELLEVDNNLEVGKKILNTQGLTAWSSFKANKHLKFLES